MECVRLRIKDVDFDRKRIHVLGKGDKWRSTILAHPLVPELQELMGHAEVKTTERCTHVMDKDISRN